MIRLNSPHLLVSAQTHPGMTGKNNEDRFAVESYRVSSSNNTPVVFSVVCDGIGGHRMGEVAAELAVNRIISTVADSFGDRPLKTMLMAIREANEAIYLKAQQSDDHKGMGATVAMVWLEGQRLYTTSLGDTRIYLIRDHSIRQINVDHTWLQEALDNGTITKEQAVNHPNSHVIRRYLGAPVVPQADQRLFLRNEEEDPQALANQGMVLNPEDKLLICTDGLTDHVQNPEIIDLINQYPDEGDLAVEKLINLACDRGGHDNITIVLLEYPAKSFSLWGWINDKIERLNSQDETES